MKKIKRQCAYCGEMAEDCRCSYRFKRMGGSSMQQHNTMRESTVAEFRKAFEEMIPHMKQDAHVAWMFSVTKLDDAKIAKADAKRKAGKVADKLLGKGRK